MDRQSNAEGLATPDHPGMAHNGHVRGVLLLIRHAHAGSKRDWQGPDGLRPLSATGRAQATGLLIRLEDYPIERIMCSPTLRCLQTMRPLAHERRLPVESSAALEVQSPATAVLGLIHDPTLRDAALCTHGEVIDRLFTQLARTGLITHDPLRWPKGATWILQRLAGGRLRARYLPPLTLHRPSQYRYSSPGGISHGIDLQARQGLRPEPQG
jgi:phosphohistidine phosphatase SixA